MQEEVDDVRAVFVPHRPPGCLRQVGSRWIYQQTCDYKTNMSA